MLSPCPNCGCALDHPAHALIAALQMGALDQAMQQGLLDAVPCPACPSTCSDQLLAAQQTRRAALVSRERYRNRNRRLARIKAEREAARRAPPAPVAQQAAVALPNAAADALARALAKAKARHS